MKTIKIFIVLLNIFMCFVSMGQIKLGVIGGVNNSKFENDKNVKSSSIKGIELGLSAEFPLLKWLKIQSEIGLVQKGGRIDFAEPTKIKNDYGVINLVPCIHVAYKKLSAYGGYGIFMEYLFKNSHDYSDLFSFAVESSTNKLDFGMALKGGVKYSFSNSSVFFQVKYSRSLNSYVTVTRVDLFRFIPVLAMKNRVVSFNIGYQIDLFNKDGKH